MRRRMVLIDMSGAIRQNALLNFIGRKHGCAKAIVSRFNVFEPYTIAHPSAVIFQRVP